MRVGYVLGDDGGCGYYRLTLPLSTMSLVHKAPVEGIKPGMDMDKIAKVLEGCDVFVLPRLSDKKWMGVVKHLQADGKKVVVDFDDNMFAVSPFSPHYQQCGLADVDVMVDGKKVPLWRDGVNFDIKHNKEIAENTIEAISSADMVTVTTDILAEAYRPYNENVVPLPNCIDPNKWRRLDMVRKTDEIRMGWFGGHSHYEDWCILQDVLPRAMERHKNLKLVIMGQKFDGTLKNVPADRIEHHEWVHTQAYPYKAAILDIDFAVIPLRDTEFNRCKSAIKWIENGALRVPSVTSYVSPYREVATPDNGIFIAGNGEKEWLEGISIMAEDTVTRQKMGEAAHRHVMDNFNVWDKCGMWKDAYEKILVGVLAV